LGDAGKEQRADASAGTLLTCAPPGKLRQARLRREIAAQVAAVVRAAVLARVAPMPPTEEDRSPPAEAQRSLARVLRRLGW
jgi:hypothetical protein